jgi:hypothetical protein
VEIDATEGGNVIISWWERNATNNESVLRIGIDNDQTISSILRLATNGTIG